MSLSKECQEYHLTPAGWGEGSFHGDAIDGKQLVAPPEDRVAAISLAWRPPSMKEPMVPIG